MLSLLKRMALVVVTAIVPALIPAPALAQLSINKLWVEFDQDNASRTDLVVRNDSKDRYYLTVKSSEIVKPGADDESRVEIADPEKLGLLVTPNRLVLEPGASRSIRLVSLNHDLAQDRVYRVYVRPEIGAIEGVAAPKQNDSAIAIKVLTAYDVLVIARPRRANPQITATRSATAVTLTNNSNSNVLLSDGSLCPPKFDKTLATACDKLEAVRLFPGNTRVIPLAGDKTVVSFQQRKTLVGNGENIIF